MKKYQIFVSSTYEDLRHEREQIVRATLEMGNIPVGMEMFSAADEQQWEIIKRQIDQSDYYVVLVAHRYGSTVESVSYTEKEHDYAVAQEVPVLGFIIDDKAPWPHDRRDTGPEAAQRLIELQRFKEKLRRRPIGFWSNAEDLHAKYSIAMMKAINATPRTGWVPASVPTGPEITAELSRLSAENARLRETLDATSRSLHAKEFEDYREIERVLKANTIIPPYWLIKENKWTFGKPISLLTLFRIFSPPLLLEASTENLATRVGLLSEEPARKKWPVAKDALEGWLADLAALGLLEPSNRKHHLKDESQYWTLSSKGQTFMKYVRQEKLVAASRKQSAGKPGSSQ